jgi:hypothetical protein
MLKQGFPNERELAMMLKDTRYKKDAGVRITPTSIRLEQALVNNSGTYTFNPVASQRFNRPQKGVALTDHFVAHSLGLYILIEDPAKPGSGDLRTYPVNEGQEAIYNGVTSIKIGNTTFVDEMDNRRFRTVPEAQGFIDASTREYDQSEYESGLCQLPEFVIFKGDQSNEIKVELP